MFLHLLLVVGSSASLPRTTIHGVPLHITNDPILAAVDLSIGTGGFGYGCGSQLPGPQVPWGLVRLGPDTTDANNDWIPFTHLGGFHFADNYVREFSHLHMVGAGVADYGNIGMMPATRAPNAKDIGGRYGWRRALAHQQMSPGYYAAALEALDNPQDVVIAELTAATTTGVHRYSFPNSSRAFVIIDLHHTLPPKAVRNSSVLIDPVTGEVTGWHISAGSLGGRIGGIQVFFVARCGAGKVQEFGVWQNGSVHPSATEGSGADTGVYLGFATSSVECAVGLSFISVTQAKANLDRDTMSMDMKFDDVLQVTEAMWKQTLAVVPELDATESADRVKFYSFLYRSCMAPTTFSEAGGNYLGFDRQVHTLAEPQQYYMSDMSIWDIHRTQAPLMATLFPNISRDIVRSLLIMLEQGGDLPKWPFANGYGECMDGSHSFVVIGDAFSRGVTDFNLSLAFAGMYKTATSSQPHAGRGNIADWLNLGFIPYEHNTKGACDTLAYSYDDWVLGNFAAAAMNRSDIAQLFINRSANYEKVWNAEHRFFCPKNSSGTWECPKDWTYVFDDRYVEGDAWHYRFWVPHNTPHLVQLFGGPKPFVAALNELMEKGRNDDSAVLPNPYYWAGNEPDLLSPFLFNYAERPDLTQLHTRWVLDNRFKVTPDGLPGNDDYGTMSAWFVWASLGLYPLAGSDTLLVCGPLFNAATIKLGETAFVRITSYNASKINTYIQSMKLDGSTVEPTLLRHNDVFRRDRNTTLEFWMGPFPAV